MEKFSGKFIRLASLFIAVILLLCINIGFMNLSAATEIIDSIYVSDIPMESWVMYGGTSEDAAPPYRPSINCNEAGGVLTIAGVEYQKGLRSHPREDNVTPAEMTFDISSYKYKYFSAVVGKDSLGNTGLISFDVLVDDKVEASSPLLDFGMTWEFKNVNVV